MVEPCVRVCWGCGKEEAPAPAKPFQTCARCREDGLEPSPFCSKECLKESWPRHKAWHAEQKSGLLEGDNANAKEKQVLSTLKNALKDQPASDTKSFMELLMEADGYKLKGSYTKAEELLNKAIAMSPENPIGHAALGEVQALLNKPQAAAALYVKAMALFPKKPNGANPHGKNLWASSALSAVFWLNVPGGTREEQPDWFNDEELKDLTATLVAVAPEDLRSWQTRAFVLCPMPDMPPQWRMPEGGMMRTEAELQEAGRCWQRVTDMTPGGKEAKRPYVARAAHCFRTAQMVAAQLQAQNAEADAASAKQAEEVRKQTEMEAAKSEVVPVW